MEKLTAAQQQNVRKMSNERLRLKIMAAGYDEEDVMMMERDVLMSTYAELWVSEKLKVGPAPADPEAEKRRLEFEKQRWEDEKAEREAEREFQRQKMEVEQEERKRAEAQREADRELERQKVEMEKLRLETEHQRFLADQQEKQRREIRENELIELKKKKEEDRLVEREERRAREQKNDAKTFGDIIRSSLIKMGTDPIDAIAFFDNVERLFALHSVPQKLRAGLINPYLNDRAQKIVGKLSPEMASKYETVKATILKEFKLSATAYLERFNTTVKRGDETYIAFASRLRGLLGYYLDSRKVSSFDELRDLLLCDRIKSVLPAECLKHILSIESTKDQGWLQLDELTESIDNFVAVRGNELGKPKAFSVGQNSTVRPFTQREPPSPFSQKQRPYLGRQPPQTEHAKPPAFRYAVNSNKQVSDEKREPRPMKCFGCGKTGHLISNCYKMKASKTSPLTKVDVKRVTVVSPTEMKCNELSFETSMCSNGVSDILVSAEIVNSLVDVMNCDTDVDVLGDDNQYSGVKEMLDRADCVELCSNVGLFDYQSNFVDELSSLKYVDVLVGSDADQAYIPVRGLCDSGSQICVIRHDLVECMEAPVVGRVQLRPFCGDVVHADVIRLNICPIIDGKGYFDFVRDSSSVDKSLSNSITIPCAVVKDLHDQMILSEDVVSRLMLCQPSDIIDYFDSVDSGQRVVCDNMGKRDVMIEGVVSQCLSPTELCKGESPPDFHDDWTQKSKLCVTSDDVFVSSGQLNAVSSTESECNNEQNGDVLCERLDDGLVSSQQISKEQHEDGTLIGCFKLAERGKGNFVVANDLLYHRDQVLGQTVWQLVVPKSRRQHVLEMGHATHGGHMGAKRTKQRIAYTFFWPTLKEDCCKYVETCKICQLKRRVTYHDRVPIRAIPRADKVFQHWYIDILGPIFGEGHKVKYNYALVVVDSFSRFPACFPLKTVTAKAVCDALMSLWEFTGCCSFISSDRGTNFTSQLTRELMKRLGCTPRFSSPWHPNSAGLVERAVGSVKSLVSKLAMDHPQQWHTYLPSVIWALREIPNATTGVAPWMLVMGHIPKGPLSILKESWADDLDLPVSFGKSNTQYLQDLHEKLSIAKEYALSHAEREQSKYVERYNLRSKDKHFQVGDDVLVLMPDSTSSKAFSKWMGPGKIIMKRSPYSYVVEVNGAKRQFHANKLRKFHVRIESVVCDPVVYDFGTFENDADNLYEYRESCIETCAIIYDQDVDFGHIEVVPHTVKQRSKVELPSTKIDMSAIKHLSKGQQDELLRLLDRYPECFSDIPGYTDVVTHHVPLKDGFKPKRLPAYRVPEKLKPEVDRQIQEMLDNNIIRKSTSPMASPLVCVLKGKDGCDGVRLAVDYRYVNSYTHGDSYPLPDLQSLFQRVGKSNLITICDCKSGYWQIPVLEEDKWLTAFVCDSGVYEFNRVPFGMKGSGNSFVRAVTDILRPVREFAKSFVDDVAIHSNQWRDHLSHLDKFLDRIKSSGLTLNLKKCRWAQKQVKFCGKIIGSGQQLADPEKLQVVEEMSPPKTKRELRRILGFFSYFREHIQNFAAVAKPLTDLTTKRYNNKIPWGESQQEAFDKLKVLLQKATEEPLYTIDFSKPFNLFVDASAYSVASALTQTHENGNELPIAFASTKLNATQSRLSTIEKEALAALIALKKYHSWLFGSKITLYSDHNPLLYLTESAPKSAKLMRWALSLQAFDLEFKYYPGKQNVVADCLSRLN